MALPLRRLIVNCGSDSGVTTTCGDTAASVEEDDVTLSSLPHVWVRGINGNCCWAQDLGAVG
jgi:hypothetical protein